MPALTAIFRARYRVVACIAFVAFVFASGAAAEARLLTHSVATASSIRLNETAQLHLIAHQGTQVLHEEGQVSGTLRGRLIVFIDIGYAEATVTFTARSSSGTLSGRGTESYYVSGKSGHFSGRMSVTGGTGAYAHASGSSLQTTGLIKRGHYEVEMTVNGLLKS